MCGIVAAYSYRGGQIDPARLLQMRDSEQLASRGPDCAGLWVDPDGRVALAHRRLAIIDLSEAAAQPMSDAEGRRVVSFNGEIYNYRDLRRRLEARGYRFRTHSDTEVLLHLFEERGEAMVHDLRGMFAFALWDGPSRSLFLARDPYGIKPLYYADDGRCTWTASQVRPLLMAEGVDRRPEAAGHAGFFLWGHVPDPFTLYRGIRALPAGCSLTITPEGPQPIQRFACVSEVLRAAEQQPAPAEGDHDDELREALRDSVRHHLVSDVEVGVFLSAGLDSAAVAALAREEGSPPQSITLAFDEYRGAPDDESPLAEHVAAALGTRHTTVRCRREDFIAERERLFRHMDQPTTDGINSYLVSRAARQAGLKVALSGLGGDELFGGYPSFREVPRLVALMRLIPAARLLGRGFRFVAAPVLRRLTSPKYAGVIEYGNDLGGAFLLRRGLFMPWELPSVLGADMAREGWNDLQTVAQLNGTTAGLDTDYARVAALEAAWYMRHQLLRDTDWASMAHGLEVRVPLVDFELLRRVAPLLVRQHEVNKAALLRRTGLPLPNALFSRPKTGFTTPVRRWLAGENGVSSADRGLRDWARHVYQTYTSQQPAYA